MPFIVLDEDKSYYLRSLKEYKKGKMFLMDTIRQETVLYEEICKELLDFVTEE